MLKDVVDIKYQIIPFPVPITSPSDLFREYSIVFLIPVLKKIRRMECQDTNRILAVRYCVTVESKPLPTGLSHNQKTRALSG